LHDATNRLDLVTSNGGFEARALIGLSAGTWVHRPRRTTGPPRNEFGPSAAAEPEGDDRYTLL